MKKRIVIGALIFSAVIGASLFLQGLLFRETVELDVSENLEVMVRGMNGNGTLEVVSNEVAYSGKDESVKRFIDSLGVHLSKDKKLSNGDVIEIRIVYDESLRKLANIELSGVKKEYVVSGLTGEDSSFIAKLEEEEDGFYRLDEVVVIDGIEVPAYLKSEKERESYVAYMKTVKLGSEMDEPSKGPVNEQWMQGKGESPTKRKDTEFYLEDYPTQVDAWFAASSFGSESSQKYKIDMIVRKGEVVGFKVIFAQEEES